MKKPAAANARIARDVEPQAKSNALIWLRAEVIWCDRSFDQLVRDGIKRRIGVQSDNKKYGNRAWNQENSILNKGEKVSRRVRKDLSGARLLRLAPDAMIQPKGLIDERLTFMTTAARVWQVFVKRFSVVAMMLALKYPTKFVRFFQA